MDNMFCFIQEYQDEETYTIISDVKKIAKNYAKRSFIFDLLAWIPFDRFMQYTSTRRLYRCLNYVYRLFKLLRLPRLKQLIKVENFKYIVKGIADN